MNSVNLIPKFFMAGQFMRKPEVVAPVGWVVRFLGTGLSFAASGKWKDMFV